MSLMTHIEVDRSPGMVWDENKFFAALIKIQHTYLIFAAQLTSPWVAGVSGGMVRWERSSRNMPAVYLGARSTRLIAIPL